MKAHLFNIHDIVLIMTMSECILLSVLQWLLPVKQPLSRNLLIAFFLLIFLNSLSVMLIWNKELPDFGLFFSSVIPIILGVSALLQGPALLFYLRSLSEKSFTLTYAHLIHLAPAVCVTLAFVWLGVRKQDLIEYPTASHMDGFWSVFKAMPVAYALICTYMIRHINATLQSRFSNASDMGVNWVRILVIGYLVHWAWSLIVHFVGMADSALDLDILDTFGIVDNYLTFILINLLFTYSLSYARQLVLASGLNEENKKTGLTVSEACIEKIQKGINEQKLHLEQNLNIEEFSRRINMPAREVSLAINNHFNSNFFEFINKHRVEEAKRLLRSEEHKDCTILDILYESGFNSKSAFQRFFKRLTGMSPSQYRAAPETGESGDRQSTTGSRM